MTDPDRLALARAHRAQGTADSEQALQDAIARQLKLQMLDLELMTAIREENERVAETDAKGRAEVAPSRGGGVHMRYRLPDGKTTRSLPRALGAWLDAAAPRRGRPPTRPEGARKVGLVLSPAAAAAWDAHEGDRSAWVSRLIERDAAFFQPGAVVGAELTERLRDDIDAAAPTRR